MLDLDVDGNRVGRSQLVAFIVRLQVMIIMALLSLGLLTTVTAIADAHAVASEHALPPGPDANSVGELLGLHEDPNAKDDTEWCWLNTEECVIAGLFCYQIQWTCDFMREYCSRRNQPPTRESSLQACGYATILYRLAVILADYVCKQEGADSPQCISAKTLAQELKNQADLICESVRQFEDPSDYICKDMRAEKYYCDMAARCYAAARANRCEVPCSEILQ